MFAELIGMPLSAEGGSLKKFNIRVMKRMCKTKAFADRQNDDGARKVRPLIFAPQRHL